MECRPNVLCPNQPVTGRHPAESHRHLLMIIFLNPAFHSKKILFYPWKCTDHKENGEYLDRHGRRTWLSGLPRNGLQSRANTIKFCPLLGIVSFDRHYTCALVPAYTWDALWFFRAWKFGHTHSSHSNTTKPIIGEGLVLSSHHIIWKLQTHGQARPGQARPRSRRPDMCRNAAETGATPPRWPPYPSPRTASLDGGGWAPPRPLSPDHTRRSSDCSPPPPCRVATSSFPMSCGFPPYAQSWSGVPIWNNNLAPSSYPHSHVTCSFFRLLVTICWQYLPIHGCKFRFFFISSMLTITGPFVCITLKLITWLWFGLNN